jgi:hypothetical protein
MIEGVFSNEVISGKDARASASVFSPASRSHAGVWTLTNQSAAIVARRASSSLSPRVPISLGISGSSNRLRSASFGRPSFHATMKAVMTGQVHCGWSDQGSPATQETSSITQAFLPSLGLWLPDLRVVIFARRSKLIVADAMGVLRGMGLGIGWLTQPARLPVGLEGGFDQTAG